MAFKPFTSDKAKAPAAMSTMPMPAAAPAKAAKGKKKPPNHGKPTKGTFKEASPKDRSDDSAY
jgi:hypothetical protein